MALRAITQGIARTLGAGTPRAASGAVMQKSRGFASDSDEITMEVRPPPPRRGHALP